MSARQFIHELNEREISRRRSQFSLQKHTAKKRGIEWCFTFEEWLAVWVNSGRLAQRGRRPDDYVMARNGDVGPYSAGNVRIIRMRENCAEVHVNFPKTPLQMTLNSLGKGRGWSKQGNHYQVTVSHKYIGLFETPEAAELAYAAACAARAQEAAA